MLPDIVIYLNTNKELVLNRLVQRGNLVFDSSFFEYENKVFMCLMEKYDRMVSINNNEDIDISIKKITKELELKRIILRRR